MASLPPFKDLMSYAASDDADVAPEQYYLRDNLRASSDWKLTVAQKQLSAHKTVLLLASDLFSDMLLEEDQSPSAKTRRTTRISNASSAATAGTSVEHGSGTTLECKSLPVALVMLRLFYDGVITFHEVDFLLGQGLLADVIELLDKVQATKFIVGLNRALGASTIQLSLHEAISLAPIATKMQLNGMKKKATTAVIAAAQKLKGTKDLLQAKKFAADLCYNPELAKAAMVAAVMPVASSVTVEQINEWDTLDELENDATFTLEIVMFDDDAQHQSGGVVKSRTFDGPDGTGKFFLQCFPRGQPGEGFSQTHVGLYLYAADSAAAKNISWEMRVVDAVAFQRHGDWTVSTYHFKDVGIGFGKRKFISIADAKKIVDSSGSLYLQIRNLKAVENN